MLLQNTSLYICSNSKNVVHGLLKIIQNYVNNKTVFFCFFSGKYKKYFFRKFSCFWVSIRIFVFEQKKKNFGEGSKKQSISKFQNFLPTPALVTKYRAYIRPYLDFGGIAMQCFPCSD